MVGYVGLGGGVVALNLCSVHLLTRNKFCLEPRFPMKGRKRMNSVGIQATFDHAIANHENPFNVFLCLNVFLVFEEELEGSLRTIIRSLCRRCLFITGHVGSHWEVRILFCCACKIEGTEKIRVLLVGKYW